MTGFTFTFSEVALFPDYNMLAKSLLKRQLFIEESSPRDMVVFQGKRSFYFGPVPALFHVPFVAATARGLPTGLAVIAFAAATCVVFWKMLRLYADDSVRPARQEFLFLTLFGFNGFMLLMVAIPSIHHEAILCASFFLLLGLYWVVKALKDGCRLSAFSSLAVGISLALALGSRFSYLLTVAFLLLVLFLGIIRGHYGATLLRQLSLFGLSAIVVAAGVGLLLAYNYGRFGSLLDFGLKYPASIYREYYLQGNYFRYDHVPFNIWSYFFRLPEFVPQIPFLMLPFYIHEVGQVIGPSYHLLHGNELAASVFVLMPVLLFGIAPLLPHGQLESVFQRSAYRTVVVVATCQLLPLLFTVASMARYYHDFLAMLLIMAYVGMRRLIESGHLSRWIAVAMTLLSILLSACVVACGLIAYNSFVKYRSPLLDLW